MTWSDLFAYGFIIFMGFYFCVLFHILTSSKIGDINDRNNF
jgi:hypothetical protein